MNATKPVPKQRRARLPLVTLLLTAAAYTAAADDATPPADNPVVGRGRYLVTTSGCHDCHTPWKMGEYGPEPDMARMLSGHPESLELRPPPALQGSWVVAASETNTAWYGPWGISYTATLTPDPETGLGTWTLRTVTDTIRSGRHEGRGRLLLPPMPIPMYKHFTDADLESIFAYLQSIPPIRNRVPMPVTPEAIAAAD
jgi:mono/diheme cytochrome c family protein